MNHRVAMVTGAAGTIGAGIVECLVEAGVRVAMIDVNESQLQIAALRFPQHAVLAIVEDICSEQGPARIDQAVHNAWGGISILVNNAGITSFDDVEQVTPEGWTQVHAVNLTAPMRLIAQLLPFMKSQRWGRIVNVSSRAGRSNPNTAGIAYASSKAALLGLTRSVATSGGPFGVTCNAVAPGLVESPMSQQLGAQAQRILLERTPLGRAGTARELGSAVAYLASEDAGFVTGACLDVNGGQSMV